MRPIYQLTPRYPPSYSGASKQAHRVNKRLATNGVPLVVVTRRISPHEPQQEVEGIPVVRLSGLPFGPDLHRGLDTLVWSLRAAWYLFRRRQSVGTLHVLDSYVDAAVFAIVGRLLRRPVLVKSAVGRGAIKNDAPHRKARLWLLRRYARMIAISRETYAELLGSGFHNDRVFLLPNGVDINEFRPCSSPQAKRKSREALGLAGDSFVAIYVGLLNKRKGIPLLLQAWKRVLQSVPMAHLLLVGPCKEQSYLSGISSKLEELGLRHSASWLGERTDVDQLLQASDVFVFPSEREGLPNALMEAMATGLPCVARPIGGVVDLIENGANGILCSGERTELEHEIAAAISKIAQDPQIARRLGEAARRSIVDRFSLDTVAEKYRELYLAVSPGNSNRGLQSGHDQPAAAWLISDRRRRS